MFNIASETRTQKVSILAKFCVHISMQCRRKKDTTSKNIYFVTFTCFHFAFLYSNKSMESSPEDINLKIGKQQLEKKGDGFF